MDGAGRLHDANRAYCAMSGYGREELLRMSISDLEVEESREETAAHIRRIQARGFDRFETRHSRKDGSVVRLTASVTFVGTPGDRMVCFFHDVTSRRRAEAERGVLQAQLSLGSRLAALGTLVAGVAHEINNPLSGEMASQAVALGEVLELAQALRGDGPIDREALARRADWLAEVLRNAQDGARQVAQIVKDLTTFGSSEARRTPVQLFAVVESALRWLRVSLEAAATVHVEPELVPDVLASTGQLEQVVVNLATNAALAMAEGCPGVITIRIRPGNPGMVRLEVADNGRGIAPDTLERVFEPYFTTRESGEGTGLGLAISHTIVTAHGGTLTVESVLGEGSTFRVELPAASEKGTGAPTLVEAPVIAAINGGADRDRTDGL